MSLSVRNVGMAALAIAVAGCSSVAPKAGVGASVANDPQGSRHERLARAAVTSGDLAVALSHAERAVEASPRDLAYRMLLGDLYLKNGRFLSAGSAFRDVLHLSPDNGRATFSLALAEIAVGKRHAALSRLERLAETAPAADLGLAFALAGDTQRALTMLDGAARSPGAGARVRQNLALAYALSGDWQNARAIAAQDLSPADVPARLAEWAAFAQSNAPADQVASLLGIKAVEDPGQPAQLALVGPEPMPVVEPVQVAEMPVEPAAVEPVRVAAAEPVVPKPAPVVAKPAPVRTRFVVQLGAYASQKSLQQGWTQLRRRYALAGVPHGAAATVAGKGRVHRLSVGYADQAQALRACRAIKSKGGGCFVRGISGDRPIQG